ncbi:PhzF family phenazine biosynthesis protein [Arthrobacter gandavensis]|uniref:PhzF family phenazine biosynthesis protein n=1 Tax=Arthrobacter gandavensis TaxID=169960 RepID=UPI00188F0EFE|nr:PhzF family phenazine biosynthesis protein [Arthrobacter gandavensis]MBF4995292.1 PhzF family phenazine biosynthesis protein [Arthrobacter gandavensis]
MTPETPVTTRPFAQIDVFSPEPLGGNPLAVVLDASGLSAARMQQFANWTNLAETTFLLPPTDPQADYRVRIFTPTEELPFAGHPTLGSAHAWLEAGGKPRQEGTLIQESAAGLVRIKTGDGGRLAFAAPALTRFGPVAERELDRVAAGLGLPREALRDAAWLVNGPEWIGVLLDSAEQVLAIRPNYPAMAGLAVGVIGPNPDGAATEFEVRTFVSDELPCEDPVTGSFNAGAAQWLIGSGRAPSSYTAAQGTVLGRTGRVQVEADGVDIWVGGECTTRIAGTVRI